ncbi:uncharacterized protein SAPINGB_P002511 [Magnusiomyces paraingens]|uniref:Protein kinase domain-containing protein n=1 Tax=Magnusiomyces paraingens TaxID=2606893 RepID=A0A5E8BEB1_9ASCO|nr:uncharacterized protein SAPINGB_P002511 [Saprochaete ingens]VVT49923.1 unnamed protein product [Saprochaete ingens]
MYGARTRIGAQNAKARLADSYAQLLREIMAPEPTNVGNYTIIRQLGEGSFGKIYLAVHRLTHTRVVLKCAAKTDPQLVREIHHHRLLRHPHIAQFYEYIVTESAVWLVIEYCPRNDLYGYLVKRRRLPEDETRRLFAQICGAVAYTHSRHCAHRDLKLENILLDKHANAKLSDFGFTRELPTPHALLETVCGTTCYMAPEVLARKRYSGEAVDVWALGVICYTLLYGEMPFEEDSDADTRLKVMTEEPAYPADGEAIVCPEVLKLLQSMLSKDPRKRPAVVEILRSAWMGAEGAAQLEILGVPDKSLFSTRAERRLLRKFHAVQFDTDAMRESVVYCKCDALAGTWALALRREEKLEARRSTRTHSVSLSRYSSSGRRDSSVSVLRREESRRNSETRRELTATATTAPATVAEEPPPVNPTQAVKPPVVATEVVVHHDHTDVATIPESVQESVPDSVTKPKKKFVAAVKQAWMKLMVPSTRGKIHSRPSTASSVASTSSEDNSIKDGRIEDEETTPTSGGGGGGSDTIAHPADKNKPHLSPAFSFVPQVSSGPTASIPTISTTPVFPPGQMFVRPARPVSQISQFSAVSTASSQVSDSEMSLLNMPGLVFPGNTPSGTSPKRHHSLTGAPPQYLRRPYMGRRSTSSSFSSIHSVTTPRTQPSKHKRTHSKASSVSSLSLKSDASVLHRGNSVSSTTSKKGAGRSSGGPGFTRHHSTPSSSRATSRVASPDSLRSTYSGASSSMASGTSGTPRAVASNSGSSGRRARSRRGLSRTVTPTNGFVLPITRAGSPFISRRGERNDYGISRHLGGLDSSLGLGITRQGTPPIRGRAGQPHLGDARMPGSGGVVVGNGMFGNLGGYSKTGGGGGGGGGGTRPSQASVIFEGEEDDDDYEEIDDDDELELEEEEEEEMGGEEEEEEEMEDLVGNVGNVVNVVNVVNGNGGGRSGNGNDDYDGDRNVNGSGNGNGGDYILGL